MIKAEGLCKVFVRNEAAQGKKKMFEKKQKTKQEFYAVDHISLEIGKGEIVGILGPNGAGKTTLLRMLGNLMKPTEGNVSITDEQGEVLTDSVEIKKRIGYLSGNTKLYNRLSVREMLQVFGQIYRLTKEEIDRRIDDIFEILDMKSFGDNRIEKLSTGQTQRASIARCLIHKPDIYIFDEPTLGLDLLSSEAIVQFMKQEKERGKTVIYSTHYMEEAQYLCDRILMIHKGKIIASGIAESLMEQTRTNNLRDVFFALIREEERADG